MAGTSIRETLGRPVIGAPLAVPSFVSVDDQFLITGYELTAERPALVEVELTTVAATEVLEAFRKLGRDSAEVRRIAEAWGPLALCVHGLPAEHSLTTPGWLGEMPFTGCAPFGSDDAAFATAMRRQFDASGVSVWAREPLQRWFELSARLDAALHVLAGTPPGNANVLWPGVEPDGQQQIALQTINEMLAVSGVYPELLVDRTTGVIARTATGARRLRGTLTWERPEPFLQASRLMINTFPGGGLLAVIALQAVNLAVGSTEASPADPHDSVQLRGTRQR